jgi:acid phosphatase type 7
MARAIQSANPEVMRLGSWIVIALAFASCSKNISGRLAAQGTGDVSAPAVARVMAGAAPAICASFSDPSSGVPRPTKTLARAPYLQRVTATGGVVAWTSLTGTSASVLVETADGGQQMSFPAAIEVDPPSAIVASRWTNTPWSPSAKQWTSVVDGLAPDTTYCYSIYLDGEPATAPAPMRSAPPPGATDHIQFVAFGDSGSGTDDQRKLLEQVETVAFDFMIHTGDIAYDNGTLADFETKFFKVYAPLLATRPMFPASGNHDYETADAAPYRHVFTLPENGGPDGVERWYSYDWGDVHLVALDTEQTGPLQAAWLEADLTANQLPWTIVYGHKPPRSSGHHGGDPGFNHWFVPILKAHQVPLVLSGHDHHYERFHPIDGTTYIVTGGGGRGVRELSAPEFASAFAEAVIHFVVVTVEGDTLTVHAIDGTGREFDSAVIQRRE